MMIALTRTLIVTGVLAGLIVAGYFEIRSQSQRAAIAELEELNQAMVVRLQAREAMIDRLSRSRRLAHLVIGAQIVDDSGDIQSTALELIELDDEGGELARQSFTVPGAVVYIDALTVRFDPAEVAEGHPLRGRTLVLFRRIFSEDLAPAQGQVIDIPGAVPPGYAVSDMSRFEQGIWAHFWDIATDAELAERMGVRVAQGEAVYKPVRSGQRYELSAEAVGGLVMAPIQRDAGASRRE